MEKDPLVQHLSAKIGGQALVARMTQAEKNEMAARARGGNLAKFRRLADPDGVLAESDREAIAANLMRLEMHRISLLAVQAKRRIRAMADELGEPVPGDAA